MAFLGLFSEVSAEPLGNVPTPIDHLVTARDLHRFGAGVYGGTTKRGIEIDGLRGERELKGDSIMAYVSFYPLTWVSAYAAGGYARYGLSDAMGGYGPRDSQWAFGARVNLLDHDVADPWIFEDRVRLTANVHYGMQDAEIGNHGTYEWSELKSSIMVSLVNDVVGNKLFLPLTISLYAGPVYSVLGGDLNETEEFGFAGGLQTQLSVHTALSVGVEDLDGTSVLASLDVRF